MIAKARALALLARELDAYRQETYAALSARVGQQAHTKEIPGDGFTYQVTVNAFWDDKPGGLVRVIGGIDDGGLRAFAPLTLDFLMAPDGSFVGE